MQRITRKHLDALADRINNALGTPLTQYTRQSDGKLNANIGHHFFDGAYGGWQLSKIESIGGSQSAPLGLGYSPARQALAEGEAFLRGIHCRAMPNQNPPMQPAERGAQVAFISSLNPEKKA